MPFLTHRPLGISIGVGIGMARVIGVVAIAAGFLLGIEGLNRPDSIWLSVALTLIVTGLCAQVYAFYRTIAGKMAGRSQTDRSQTDS